MQSLHDSRTSIVMKQRRWEPQMWFSTSKSVCGEAALRPLTSICWPIIHLRSFQMLPVYWKRRWFPGLNALCSEQVEKVKISSGKGSIWKSVASYDRVTELIPKLLEVTPATTRSNSMRCFRFYRHISRNIWPQRRWGSYAVSSSVGTERFHVSVTRSSLHFSGQVRLALGRKQAPAQKIYYNSCKMSYDLLCLGNPLLGTF
jgi:hypothetical protein